MPGVEGLKSAFGSIGELMSQMQKEKFSTSGTFSAAAAWGLGGGGTFDRIEKNTAGTKAAVERLLRKAQGGLVFEE